MRSIRRLSLGSLGVVTLTLSLLLSGCGGTSTATDAGSLTAAGTATAGAEATMVAGENSTAAAVAVNSAALPTATLAPAAAADVEMPGCPPAGWPVQPKYETVGALKVSIPQIDAALNYPSALMPNNQPNAPFQVPLTSTVAQQPMLFHPNPPVNPSLETGYVIQVCNQTSVAHTVTSLSVRIASFTPSSGPITVWHLCQDGPYDVATGQTTSGCGGAAGQVDWLAATLPHDSVGASAPAIANARENARGPNLPVTISPNKAIEFLIAVNGLTSQGAYTLNFSVGVDGAAPATLTPSDGAFFIAPSPIVWTGTACQTPVMRAKIPASSKDVFYVCPPAA